MYEFIVLGLIPGTNFELTFAFWLILASALLTMVGLRKLRVAQLMRNGVITLSLFVATRHQPQA